MPQYPFNQTDANALCSYVVRDTLEFENVSTRMPSASEFHGPADMCTTEERKKNKLVDLELKMRVTRGHDWAETTIPTEFEGRQHSPTPQRGTRSSRVTFFAPETTWESGQGSKVKSGLHESSRQTHSHRMELYQASQVYENSWREPGSKQNWKTEKELIKKIVLKTFQEVEK